MTTALAPLSADEAARAAESRPRDRGPARPRGPGTGGGGARRGRRADRAGPRAPRGRARAPRRRCWCARWARCSSLEFRRIQFTPDLMPSDITGVNLLAGPGTFTFRPGPIFGDLVLGDEINRAPAKTQAALLEAMQERRVTVDGVSHPLPESFTVFATQNPIEFEGTYPLPEAELDRFLVKVIVGYPEEPVEQGILAAGARTASRRTRRRATAWTGWRTRRGLARAARGVPAGAGRAEPGRRTSPRSCGRPGRAPVLTLGASPRGSVALLKMAQASALLEGRAYVDPGRREGAGAGGAAPPGRGGARAGARGRGARTRRSAASSRRSRRPGDGRCRRGAGCWGAAALAAVAPARPLVAGRAGRPARARRRSGCSRFLADALPRPAPARSTCAARRRSPSPSAAASSSATAGAIAGRRRLRIEVQEHLPEPLGGADTPLRRLELPPYLSVEERLELEPVRRGIGTGGTLDLRVSGPLGLAWRQSRIELPWTATVYPEPARRLRCARCRCRRSRRREAGLRNVRAPGRGPALRGAARVGPGRRHPHHRLEGHRAPRQADRAAVRGRAAAAGA